MQKKSRRAGFTLIELTIVMAMTALIATIMLVNYRQGEKLKRVQLTLDAVTNTIRLGQNYSLSGKQIQRSSGACSNDNSAADYRVSFTGGVVFVPLYADDKCGASILVDQYNFLTGARIKSNSIAYETCTPICSTATIDFLAIKFTPPFGTITASTDNVLYTTFSKADIVFESLDGTKTKTLRIDGVSGRIGN